jgi:hypothetical protein
MGLKTRILDLVATYCIYMLEQPEDFQKVETYDSKIVRPSTNNLYQIV